MNKRIQFSLLATLLALLLAAWAAGTAWASDPTRLTASGVSPPAVMLFSDVVSARPVSGAAAPGAAILPPAPAHSASGPAPLRTVTALPLGAAPVVPPVAVPTVYICSAFQDVVPADPNAAAIGCVTCAGALEAYPCDSVSGQDPCVGPGNLPYFHPDEALMRGQLARLVVVAAGWNLDTTGGPHFTDVPTSHPFYAYVETAVHHGVISGYPDGTFRPDNDVYRAPFAKILYLALGGGPLPNPPPSFLDVHPADYFYTPVVYLASQGIMNGYGDDTFRPFNNISRGDASWAVADAFLSTACSLPTPGPLGTISGTIYADSIAPGNVVDGASVSACGPVGCVYYVVTGPDGHYTLGGLVAGQYNVTAFGPGSMSYSWHRIGPLDLAAGQTLLGQNIVLHTPVPPAPGTLEPSYLVGIGIPVVLPESTLVLQSTGCLDGTASYQILQNGVVVLGPLPMSGAGTYTANVAALAPLYGPVQFVITIACPGPSTTTITFDVYIDPSGHVRTTAGDPIPGASVTLSRADSPAGPFALVPDGSGLMSPANRLNPDTTHADGHFGWDVVAGAYQVAATRAGCYAPGNPGQPTVDSAVLTIPPAVTNLDLRLECPGTTFTDVPTSQPFWRYVHWLGTWGYVAGYACGGPGEACDGQHNAYFRPSNPATRGQFAKILGNALLWADAISPTQQTFADVPPSQPFWLYVERVAAHGAISGYACGGPGEPCDGSHRPYFRPGANITRGQIAKILTVAVQFVAPIPATQQTFADVPNTQPYWVYAERAAGAGLISGYACGGPGEGCDAQHRPYFRPYSTATRGQISKMVDLALAQP